MTDDATSEHVPTDWASLRAEAEKLGISLSELQQKKRQLELSRAAKNNPSRS
jgi:hypothetical protein